MYKKSPQGWLKHWDFILLDIICLQLAFVVAYFARQGFDNPYSDRVSISYGGICIRIVPDCSHVSQPVLSGNSETWILHRIHQDSETCINGHAFISFLSLCNTAGNYLFSFNFALYSIFVFML